MYECLEMELRHCFTVMLLGLISLEFHGTSMGTSIACDAGSSQVMIKFQFVNPKHWTDSIISQLKKSVSNFVNAFCQANSTDCGLKSTRFTTGDTVWPDEDSDSNSIISIVPPPQRDSWSIDSSDVIIVPGHPKKDLVHSLVSLYVKLPGNGVENESCKFIRKPILQDIIINNRGQLHSDLQDAAGKMFRDSWGFRVSNVDGVRVIPSANSRTNAIAIPIICGFTFTLAVVVAILECQSRLHQRKGLECIIRENQAPKASASPHDGSFAIVEGPSKSATSPT